MKETPRFKNTQGGTFVGRYERLDVWVLKNGKIHCRPSDHSGRAYTCLPDEHYRAYVANPKHQYPELADARIMALDFLRDPSISPNAGQKHG